MERFSQRESVFLGYSSQRSITINSSSSPKTPYRSSDLDFHDVFGGPPKRSSIHEKRFSFTEAMNNSGQKGDNDEASMSHINPWSGLSERPVFGEENVNRRRYPSNDFFDDIFRGDEPLSSTPRKNDRDVFSSAPGSRVVSPVRSLPPKAEPFGTSLPPQFSLPAKLTKGVDFPAFGSSSTTRSPSKLKDGASNGINFSYSPSSPLSRFSSEAIQGQEELRNDVRQSPLSQEFSLSSKGSPNLIESDKTNTKGNLKDANRLMEVPTNSSQFHFSIYKWACKGVPFVMLLRGGSRLRLKEQMKLERSSSSNGRLSSESMARESSTMKTFRREFNQKETDPLVETSAQDKVEPSQIVAETILPTPESETLSSIPSVVENVPGKTTVESTENPAPVVDVSKNVKKQDGKKATLNGVVEVDKASFQDSGDNNLGRNRVKGKVKEFVKIFNQESSSKPKDNVDFRSQSSKWKKRGTFSFRAGNEASVSTTGRDEKIPTVHVNNTIQEASIMVDKHLKQSEKEHSAIKTADHIFSDNSSRQRGSSASSTASIPDSSKAIVEDTDESFQGILIKELPQDENELPQSGDNHKEIQVMDAKIQYWSNGKKGNIRSLLSTLQYVLWPESGWKPVPLVDIIEGNSVKRAYQKALLCLHPDKLQQKGAASQQKYIAEKVFDILQEAWTHFNSLGSQ